MWVREGRLRPAWMPRSGAGTSRAVPGDEEPTSQQLELFPCGFVSSYVKCP